MLAPSLFLALAATTAAAPHGHPIHMRPPPITCELAADSVVVPMRMVRDHLRVDVMVEGKGPFPFLFDTGAGGSVMDLAFAKQQGLALGQEVMVSSPNGGGRPGRMVTLDTLRIGGLATHGMMSIAFEGLPFPPAPDRPVGVVGPYDMKGLLITLDYAHERLVFRRGVLPAPDGREIFGWDPARHLPEIQVTLGGAQVLVHLDSGAPGGLMMPVEWGAKLPLAGPLVEMGRAKTVDRDDVTKGATLDGDLVLGRWTLERPTVRFSAGQRGVGNVGNGILRQFTITIDPANARLRLVGPPSGKLVAPVEKKKS